jgi:hypothetical protein
MGSSRLLKLNKDDVVLYSAKVKNISSIEFLQVFASNMIDGLWEAAAA